MSGSRAISTTSRRELSSSFFFLQGKVPKEIHAILTETLACFLPGRANDLSAPLYWRQDSKQYTWNLYVIFKSESTFLSNAPRFPKGHCFLEGSQHQWDNIVRGQPKYLVKNLCQCHFVYHKSYKYWPGIEQLFLLVPNSLLIASALAVAGRKEGVPAVQWRLFVAGKGKFVSVHAMPQGSD